MSHRTINHPTAAPSIELHDSLTGLPNRNFFIESLRQWLEQVDHSNTHNQIAMLTLDIDRFKLFNETLGSSGGDKLLTALGNRLKRITRNGDIVARFGSDEFSLLIAMREMDSVEIIAQRYYRMLNDPFTIDDRALFVSLSTGIAIAPQDGSDVQTLLNNANQAHMQAKRAGGNQFQFYRASMTKAAKERLALEQDLRNALSGNQLELLYQPKVDAQTLELLGAEALIIWNHPNLGKLKPDTFIPIAEETGLIVDIGYWVIKEACRQTQLWHKTMPNFQVSVNLSARQFLHSGLVETVEETLKTYNLPPESLDIEITESLAMFNVEHSKQTLLQLKQLGIKLSLDDFGTGYSSLAQLYAFPVDAIKIDRAFVMRIGTDEALPADEKMIVAIIAMANSLELKVIAEGVETQYQVDFLKQQGCDVLQGYYCGRPISVDVFEELSQQRYNVYLSSVQ